MITDIALLSGGLATRLYPVTRDIPKAMIDINGRPFIHHQLELLKRNGLEKVVLCVGYLGDMIRDYAGDGKSFGLDIRYSYDGDRLLGTGGAIKKALKELSGEFFVMYGDSYLPVDFRAVSESFSKDGKKALMTVIRNNNEWDKSNVIFDKGVIKEYNKKISLPEMEYIDYGLGIIRKSCFDGLKENEACDLADIYRGLVSENELAGFEVNERFYEIGSFKGIEETKEFLK
ncbi:MAG: nucleotidyltransferase family protein [Brevinematales bacterium]|jgi:NDP-sugar pyrophosphorylase family protein